MIHLLKITIKRIQKSKVVSSFMIFGFIISMLMISFNASYIFELQRLNKDKLRNAPPNALAFGLNLNANKEITADDISNILRSVKESSGIILNSMVVNIDSSGINNYFPVSGEWFSSETDWHYPLVEGKYYSVDDLQQKLKVVLLGKDLKKYTYMKNRKCYIKLFQEEYEVRGFIGFIDKKSLWDSRVFIPALSLPKPLNERLLGGNFNFILYSKKDYTSIVVQDLLLNTQKTWNNASVSNIEAIKTDNISDKVFSNMDLMIGVGFLVYIVSIINSVNIVSFWVEQRRFEIGIRKAFGHSNINISMLLFCEILGISVVSCMTALVIQFFIGLLIKDIMGHSIRLYIQNIFIASLAVLITSLVTSLLPIIKSLKMQPTEAMKL